MQKYNGVVWFSCICLTILGIISPTAAETRKSKKHDPSPNFTLTYNGIGGVTLSDSSKQSSNSNSCRLDGQRFEQNVQGVKWQAQFKNVKPTTVSGRKSSSSFFGGSMNTSLISFADISDCNFSINECRAGTEECALFSLGCTNVNLVQPDYAKPYIDIVKQKIRGKTQLLITVVGETLINESGGEGDHCTSNPFSNTPNEAELTKATFLLVQSKKSKTTRLNIPLSKVYDCRDPAVIRQPNIVDYTCVLRTDLQAQVSVTGQWVPKPILLE